MRSGHLLYNITVRMKRFRTKIIMISNPYTHRHTRECVYIQRETEGARERERYKKREI